MILKKYLFAIILLFAGACFLFANSVIELSVFGIGSDSRLRSYGDKVKHGRAATINTEGCAIPAMDPLDDSIKMFVEYPKDLPQCPNPTLALLAKNRTSIWVRYDKYVLNFYNITDKDLMRCCYRGFYRPVAVEDVTSSSVDNRATYEPCINFNDTIEARHEFVRVNCSYNSNNIYEQFFLFAPKKIFIPHDDKAEIVNKTGYNVLILGIDSVSRLNLYRTMPNTVSYLNSRGAVEMFGYNKVGFNTFPNLVPMLMGVKVTELNKTCHPHSRATFDNCPFVWEWYKQAGFYTAFMEDATEYATFNYKKSGFIDAPTDYYVRTFLHEAEDNVGTGEKLCMHDTYYYKVILDYIEEITWRLKSRRLFGLFWETAMSHDKLNYPIRMDDDYVKMFERLEASGYLNETIVLFVSDHGMRWGSIRETDQGRLEESLPFLYLLTPQSFKSEYKKAYDNLKINSGRLTTPFDVHETLTDLIDLKNIDDEAISARSAQSYALNRGISLFLSVPGNRTCGTADIDDQWCTCRKDIRMAKDNPRVVEAASVLIIMINFRLMAYRNCASLKLYRVVDALEIRIGKSKLDDSYWTEYLITVETVPGHAVFEAALRKTYHDKSWQLKGEPSRLTKYERQSQCVDDISMKNFCFCT